MLKIEVSKNIKSIRGETSLDISADFNPIAITGIYGNSGEGKTTLFNMIAGIAEPTQGSILLHDTTWFDSSKKINLKTQKRNIGYIFQQNSLFPHFTVKENILYAVNDAKSVDISNLLEQVEMPGMEDRYPHQLSGGQIQRIAIARALAQKANIIMMDEPFSALDLEIKQKLYRLLKEFKQKFNLMILIVTHDINDIYQLCDDVLWIKDHKVDEIISKDSFKQEIELKLQSL